MVFSRESRRRSAGGELRQSALLPLKFEDPLLDRLHRNQVSEVALRRTSSKGALTFRR